MTAEVAIMNTSAVVLAADSVGTTTKGRNEKFDMHTDKIFELISHQPIGIMIYNSLDFMGLPLETIIKEYRNITKTKFDRVGDAALDFLNYIETTLQRTTYTNQDSEDQVIIHHVRGVKEYIKSTTTFNERRNNRNYGIAISRQIQSYLELMECPLNGRMMVRSRNVRDNIGAVVDRIFANEPLSARSRGLLIRFVCYALSECKLTDYSTGFIFCGFGTVELTPSLTEYIVDGMYNNSLRVVKGRDFQVDPGDIRGEIIPFAQDDIARRFIDGLDPDLQEHTEELFHDVIEEFFRRAVAVTGGNSTYDRLLADLDRKFKEGLRAKIRRDYRSPLRERISQMSKPEMARYAQAIIETTTLQRKFSWSSESVGGDVDVAVISRAEGLVWIRRKLYFDASLNPRHAARVMRS